MDLSRRPTSVLDPIGALVIAALSLSSVITYRPQSENETFWGWLAAVLIVNVVLGGVAVLVGRSRGLTTLRWLCSAVIFAAMVELGLAVVVVSTQQFS